MEIITLIIIGLSLSIDAFSLSLAYGLLNIPKKTIISTSITVGIFHFIMPILGMLLGNIITDTLNLDSKYILLTILILILIEMIKSLKEENKEHELNIINMLIFAFLVSFDSFTLGIGIKYITSNIFFASIIFMILSSLFTFLGFILGKYLTKKATFKIKLIGIILLLVVILYFLCK